MHSRNASFAMTRIVLDTNAVLDLLLWHNAELDCVASALSAGRVQLLCDESCLRELRTVLRYAKFGLDETQAAVLYGEYCARIEMLPLPESRDTTQPRCQDREDQKFFDLAVRAGADLLVSRDRALLRLGRHRLCPPHLRVLAPPALPPLLDPSAEP
jgi:putative PIN family toxin of toxin-antitoxin system